MIIEKKHDKIPIFVYYRISTELQNFKAQKKNIEKFLNNSQQEYEVIDTFRDEGISGFLGPQDRPDFNEMINRLNEVRAILCYDWDRISRDVKFASYFMFYLKEEGINVIEGGTGKVLNFDQMGDRIWTYLKSEMGSEERLKIKRRQKAGIEAYKEEHGRWGQERKYGGGSKGTKFSKKRFWEKYEILRLANVSKSAIARLFKISPPTLYKRLKEDLERYKKIEDKVNELFNKKKI